MLTRAPRKTRPRLKKAWVWSRYLGEQVVSRPWWVIGAWAALILLAVPTARKAPSYLLSGSGEIAHSPSFHADSLIRADFENPYSQLLVLTLKHRSPLPVDSESSGPVVFRALEKNFSGLSQVTTVMTPANILDKRLLPAPGTGEIVLIGLKAESIRDAEQAVPIVRNVADGILKPLRRADTTFEWAVTGRPALSYDFNLFNARETAKAERRMIPLTLLILLVTFGSLVAAGLPLLLGILSTVLSMASVSIMARYWPISNLVQTAASMIGLAVGIDYSLLLIHRYREIMAVKRAQTGAAVLNRLMRNEALVESVAIAGKTIFYSGATVMIGLAGLLFTPVMETRSIGWGGCIVVLVSLGAALTFLPALLSILGPIVDWPGIWSRKFAGPGPGRHWTAWSNWVLGKAPIAVIVGLAALAVLSYPARYSRFGFPEGPFIPSKMEFTRGFSMLRDMGLQGVLSPINIILSTSNGEPILTSERIPALFAFSKRIRGERAVGHIFGPVDLADNWPLAKYLSIYSDVADALDGMPFVTEKFLAKDGKSLLMQVELKQDIPLDEAKRIARELPPWAKETGLKIEVGGQAVQTNDFDRAMYRAYPAAIFFVLAVTFLFLLLFFRSPLIAMKALIMNALSVLAGYGVVVFVFQLGHGHALFGAPSATQVVPLNVPLMLFCILFGLSMDYEVFLLNRIRERFLETGNNTHSVAHGLAATGPVITSAALIMTSVFGAFAFSQMIMVQMLGLGLATAVLVDATLIRILLVPAIMKLAGKWNWWPYGVKGIL
ncbi:MAG: family transporter [Fibrobacteres bacterium]|nr:family transporter [Fibrobacterota bacterium]